MPIPPKGNFPLPRYKEYLATLKGAGGEMIFRHDDRIGVLMWGSGFGGDTIHLEVCWRESEPANLVASLDEFHKTQQSGESAFQHIEGNWYLWADW